MFTYLTHKIINKAKWDTCINASSNSIVYVQSWYLDLVSPKWEALILGDYKAVFPLTIKKKHGVVYLCNPYFVQQLGIFYHNEINEQELFDLISFIRNRFLLIDINFNHFNVFNANTNGISYCNNYKLILHASSHQLFKNYKGNCRRNIRIALKNNLEILFEAPVESTVDLFKNNQAKKYTQFKSQDYNTFLALYAKAKEQIQTESIACINAQQELIAGAIFFIYNHTITFVFSGLSEEGRKHSAMFLIIQSLIEKYALLNYTIDFEGGNSAGMASFYAGFGATNYPFPNFKHIKWPLSLIK